MRKKTFFLLVAASLFLPSVVKADVLYPSSGGALLNLGPTTSVKQEIVESQSRIVSVECYIVGNLDEFAQYDIMAQDPDGSLKYVDPSDCSPPIYYEMGSFSYYEMPGFLIASKGITDLVAVNNGTERLGESVQPLRPSSYIGGARVFEDSSVTKVRLSFDIEKISDNQFSLSLEKKIFVDANGNVVNEPREFDINSLSVQARMKVIASWVRAFWPLALTVIIEGVLAALIFRRRFISAFLLAALINVISWPLVYIAYGRFEVPWAAAEIGVCMFEWPLLAWLLRLKPRAALVLSADLNLVTASLGVVVSALAHTGFYQVEYDLRNLAVVSGLAAFLAFAISLAELARWGGVGMKWLAWIPVLNLMVLLKVAGKPMWWIVLLIIPIVNIVFFAKVFMALSSRSASSKRFGLLAAVLLPLSLFYLPYLAFWRIEKPPQSPIEPALSVNLAAGA